MSAYNQQVTYVELLTKSERRRLDTEAACKGMDPNIFYPMSLTTMSYQERSENVERYQSACRECPVKQECLLASFEHPYDATKGIWGGTNTLTRKRMVADIKRETGDRLSADWPRATRDKVREVCEAN